MTTTDWTTPRFEIGAVPLPAALPISERVPGPEHPDTVATRANLAYWTGQAEGGPGPELD